MKKKLFSSIFNILIFSNLLFSSVVINELMINPVNALGNQFSEYIELYNTSNEDINLEGWTLSNTQNLNPNPSTITLPSIIIYAHSYLTLGMTNNTGLNQGMTFDYEWGVGDDFLYNAADDIVLTDNNDTIIHSVYYHDASWPVVEGSSIELNNPLNNSSSFLNWSPGTTPYDNLGVNLGSPGEANSNLVGVPEISYSNIDFGVTQFGTETTIPVTLVSSGGSSVTISDLIDNGNQYFSYVTPNFPITLQPNDIFTLDITFNHETPNQQEVFDLHFVTDALPLNTISVYVTAESGTPQIYIPQDIAFNDTEAMLTDTSSVFVGNSGTYTLNLSSASLVGDDLVADFEILSDFPIAILPGESQPIDIKFSPSESNTYNMTLNIEHDDFYYQIDDSTYEYNFTAIGVAPSIELDTENIIFPTIHEGEQTTYTLSVSNTGTGDLIVSDVTFDNNVFSVENTSFTVNEGQSYSLDINFNPISMGTITGTMTITSNGHNANTNTVSLTAEVVSGTLVLVPTDFALIQDAISYAEEGDTILVSPGTYNQTFSFQGKAVTVLGQEGPDNTFIGLEDDDNILLYEEYDYYCHLEYNHNSCSYWSYYESANSSELSATFVQGTDEEYMLMQNYGNWNNSLFTPGFSIHHYDSIVITFKHKYTRGQYSQNDAYFRIRQFQGSNGSNGNSLKSFVSSNYDWSQETITINPNTYSNWDYVQFLFYMDGYGGDNHDLYIDDFMIEGIIDGERRELYSSTPNVSFTNGEDSSSILSGFTINSGEYPSLSKKGISINSSSPLIENIIFSPRNYEMLIAEENIWHNSENNDAYMGSAIYIKDSNANFNNIFIDSHYLTGMETYDSNIWSSGPIYIEESNLVFNNLTITNSGQAPHMEGGNIYGGAVYMKSSSAVFNNSIFTNNTSYGSGGVFYINNNNNSDSYIIEYNDCDFDNNSSTVNGGSIYGHNINSTTFNINNSIFQNNSAEQNGGAIYLSSPGNFNMINSTITTNNSSSGNGGGVYISNGYNIFNNVIISQNQTYNEGGGVYISSTGYTYIYDSFINDNVALYGGGFYLNNNNIQLYDTEIRRNTASTGAGIFENNVSNMITERLLVANNSASEKGGGMYFTNYDPVFTNFTLVNNSATFSGSGLYCESAVFPVFINSIIWGNQSADGAHIYLSSGSEIILNYNNIQSGQAGIVGFDDIIFNNNISLYPDFTDSENEDYTLLVTSPCVDSGNPSSAYDADGTLADMGYIFFDQIMNNPGCMDETSQNYDPDANVNLGCIFGPSFISIYDRPEDQGGYVFLNWNANTLDILPNTDVLNYSVWRHIPDERGWEHLGDVPASYETSYGFTAPTINTTAVDGDTLYTTFKIKAHTSEQNLFYESGEGVGFSIDNIVPSAPEGLSGNYSEDGIVISWNESDDLDLSYYTLYRENEYLGTSATNLYTDTEMLQPPINYSIMAYDINNNASEYSQTYMYTSDISGDITQDYIVNVLDIIVLVNIIFDTYMGGEIPPDYILDSSDMNEDGIINILDVVAIVNLIMNITN